MKILLIAAICLFSFSANAAKLSLFIPTQLYDSGERSAIQAKIASTSAACAAAPYRGTVYYFCDCGVGAEADCVAGNDANSGLDTAHPKQLIHTASLMERDWLDNTNHTIAFCKGGSFVSPNGEYVRRTGCTEGTTCDDWREYSPTTFVGTADPILRLPTGDTRPVLNFTGGTTYGGIRLMNLDFQSEGTGMAFYIYDAPHDVAACNVAIDGFDIGFYIGVNVSPPVPRNISLTGSTISNSVTIGYLGAGTNTHVDYNTFEGNGGSRSLDHSLYLSAATEVVGMHMVGNYIHGQHGNLCSGAVVEAHGRYAGFEARNNYIAIDADKAGQECWGLEFAGAPDYAGEYFNDLVISNNTVINGGNTGITTGLSPGAIIENNRVFMNWAANGALGIKITATVAQSGEPLNTQNTIRNNVVYFGPNATGTNSGIVTKLEGTQHVVSNNAVVSDQTVGGLICYSHELPVASYTFVNNNHCYAPSITESWEHSYATLSAWQIYSGHDMNSETCDPAFTNPAILDFHSTCLKGKGSSVYKSVNSFTGTTRPTPPAIGAYE